MANQVYVRPFNKNDATEKKLLAEWLYASREKNRFDPRIFDREQVIIFTCFDNTGIVGFVPVALAYVLESLAFRPGLSPITEAKAMLAMQHTLVNRAFEKNIPYAYFVTFDSTVLEFAQRSGNWKPVVVPMLTINFSDLEVKNETDNQPNS